MSVIAIFGGRSEIGLEIAARLAAGNTVVLVSRPGGDRRDVPDAARVLAVPVLVSDLRLVAVVAAVVGIGLQNAPRNTVFQCRTDHKPPSPYWLLHQYFVDCFALTVFFQHR